MSVLCVCVCALGFALSFTVSNTCFAWLRRFLPCLESPVTMPSLLRAEECQLMVRSCWREKDQGSRFFHLIMTSSDTCSMQPISHTSGKSRVSRQADRFIVGSLIIQLLAWALHMKEVSFCVHYLLLSVVVLTMWLVCSCSLHPWYCTTDWLGLAKFSILVYLY